MELSIIIPAYNEEKRISSTLDDYAKFFNNIYKKNYEIIVVLNGCKDNTLVVVKNFSKKYSSVRFLDFKEAIGKGGAVIEGFRSAKGKLIGFVDADNSTKADAYYELVRNIDGYDSIIASRWIDGAKVSPRQPVLRRVASRAFNFLVRLLFGIEIHDSQCGAKLFKKDRLKKVLQHLGITRWAFDVDLLYQFKRNGFSIKEIPTVWSDSPGSSLNVKRASKEMFLAIVRLRLIYSPFRFIVKIYDKL
ncbi:glycosyltransferase family 2 protein [Candidatus Woesearchaeota archaeon]|nr:glycosyltransferase family 2 protein [Candidatus Woesearchaeota archaeon]